eukprot:m.171707 g.171707  ORF g.171707 m.171707 type:complete len:101 (+) comp21268_c0_seq1:544-846(+)
MKKKKNIPQHTDEFKNERGVDHKGEGGGERGGGEEEEQGEEEEGGNDGIERVSERQRQSKEKQRQNKVTLCSKGGFWLLACFSALPQGASEKEKKSAQIK